MRTKLWLLGLLLIVITTFVPGKVSAQSETHDFVTYDTLFKIGYAGLEYRLRISRPKNMFTPGHADAASRPAIITMPGLGEAGTNYGNLQKFGPHYWMNNGWDGGVKLGNGTHYPIIITVLPNQAWPRGPELAMVMNHLLNTYHIKRNSVHAAGLSMGGFSWTLLLCHQATAGAETGMKLLKSVVALEGISSETFAPYNSWSLGENSWGVWAKKYGGKFFGLEGTKDVRDVWRVSENMNKAMPGSAYFAYQNIGGGGHCCWNDMYSPARTNWTNTGGSLGPNVATGPHANTAGTYKAGSNIFQWMLRQGDTTMVNGTTVVTNESPDVSAGTNKTITLPANSVTLSGSATDGDGTIASYQWSKISGPSAFSIASPGSAQTTINNLVAGTYTFQLKATDNKGASGTATVSVTVNAEVVAIANKPPVVSAGSAKILTLPLNLVTLIGNASDPDGTIVSYQWSKLSGPSAFTISSPLLATTSIINLVAGTYVFELKVTDDKGATSTASVEVKVNSLLTTPSTTPPPSPSSLTVTKVGITEYRAGYLASDGNAYSMIGNVMAKYDIGSRKVTDINSGGYSQLQLLDDQGYIWTTQAGGSVVPVRIEQDNTGKPFNGNKAVYGYYYTNVSIRSDGSLWYWGQDNYNLIAGTAAITKPVKISPAGMQVKKVAMGGINLVVLTTDGQVWQWSKNGSLTPVKKSIPRPAVDIFSGQYNVSGCIIPDASGDQTTGYPFVWGSYFSYWGGNTGYDQPTSVKALWGVTAPIKEIAANVNTIHYIDVQGRLFGIGDNPNGEIGNGEELVNKHTYATPYAWSWNPNELLTGSPAVQIRPDIKWNKLYKNNTMAYFVYATDVNNGVYFWGRDKALVSGRGYINWEEATYPNALDVTEPVKVNPLQAVYQAYSFSKGSISAGADQNIATSTASLTGSAVAPKLIYRGALANGRPDLSYQIASYKWTKLSGTGGVITSPNAASTTVTGLTTGTYKFQLLTTDNNKGTMADVVTINVTSTSNKAPTVNAGSNINITLPANSATLNGTATDADGSIASYQWNKISGPSSFSISSPKTASTAVTSLVAGSYQFELKATDNQGAVNSAVVTVTVNSSVNPAPNIAPTVSAGTNKTITLPLSSTTLTGSANDADGTIASYQWRKVSGPASVTISSPTSATTNLNNLVAGVYVFELKASDNSGASATANATVTVNQATTTIPNKAPIVTAGKDKSITLPLMTTSLLGVASDPDGSIVAVKWTKVSGPTSYSIGTSTKQTASVNHLVEGVYEFKITVTDDDGAMASDVVQITVNPSSSTPTNLAPVVTAGSDKSIRIPVTSTTISGSATDRDGKITSYKWAKISGPSSFSISTPNNASTLVTKLVQGVYVFELTAVDNLGKSAKSTVKVTVAASLVQIPINITPVVSAGVDKVIRVPASSVTLIGSANDADGKITSYKWTKISGPSSYKIGDDTKAATGVNKLVAGVYKFQLRATDNRGATSTSTVTVTVNTLSGVSASMARLDTDTATTVTIYPNPVRDVLNINITARQDESKTVLRIYNVSGGIVYSEEFSRVHKSVIKSINVSNLKNGSYFLSVEADPNDKKVLPFIKL